MTKRENYTALRAIVADNAELVAFIDHELELLDKKNSKRSDKPTAKQVANEETKAVITEILLHAENPMTIGDIMDAMGTDLSNQKISALVTALVNDGAVVRTVVKRKAYFTIG